MYVISGKSSLCITYPHGPQGQSWSISWVFLTGTGAAEVGGGSLKLGRNQEDGEGKQYSPLKIHIYGNIMISEIENWQSRANIQVSFIVMEKFSD